MADTKITPAPYCVVADDEPRLRQVLSRLMTSEGFTPLEAPSGVEALELLAQHAAPLLLSDLRMPRMDGIELLQRVRECYPDVAVVMITAVADIETALRCLAMGAMDYLTKPFHLEEVRTRVGQAMEKRRLIIENRAYQEHLEDRVTEQARLLEETFMSGIHGLVYALEVKDHYTRGHSTRVSQYAMEIARGLGLDSAFVQQVELGGQVHDIGKIGVREAVLNKPGPLTAPEYEHIMIHPVVGWNILSPLFRDRPVALSIVRSHHERYDGTGRPDRLKGDEIPLSARIACVADALDAMTSGRMYRGGHGMTLDEACTDLVRGRGTQFDPQVLDLFFEMARTGAIVNLVEHPDPFVDAAETLAPPVKTP